MYENFLKENLPDDIRKVFEALMNASEKHLAAFQRQVDGVTGGSGNGNSTGNGSQTGKGNGGTGGNGQGNRNTSQENCIVE